MRESKPEGELEDLLVQKIAATYWRLRRLYRHEVGVIGQHLDTVEADTGYPSRALIVGESDWGAGHRS